MWKSKCKNTKFKNTNLIAIIFMVILVTIILPYGFSKFVLKQDDSKPLSFYEYRIQKDEILYSPETFTGDGVMVTIDPKILEIANEGKKDGEKLVIKYALVDEADLGNDESLEWLDYSGPFMMTENKVIRAVLVLENDEFKGPITDKEVKNIAVAKITNGDKTTYYRTLEEAISACPENAGDSVTKIEMLANTSENVEIPNGKNILLDLCGTTISAKNDTENDATIIVNGKLNVIDSKSNEDESIKGNGQIKSINGVPVKVGQDGEFTLGTNDDKNEVDVETPQINGGKYGIQVEENGKLNFYDGKVSGKINAIDGIVSKKPDNYGVSIERDGDYEIATLKGEYTVSFDANGGTLDADGNIFNIENDVVSKKVLIGNVYGDLPKVNEREGYKFLGWETTSETPTSITENTKVEILENHTLKAKWEANRYTVSYNNNGGTGTIANISAEYDKEFKLSDATELSKAGYRFKEWNTQSDGNGTSYAAGINVKNLTAVQSGGVNLYAIWIDDMAPSSNKPTGKATTNTITVNCNQTDSGSGINPDTIEYAIFKDEDGDGVGEWVWQTSPEFKGLDADTEYRIKTRVKDNDGNGPIESEEGTIKTNKIEGGSIEIRKDTADGDVIVPETDPDNKSNPINSEKVVIKVTPSETGDTKITIIDPDGNKTEYRIEDLTQNDDGSYNVDVPTKTGTYEIKTTTTDGTNTEEDIVYIYIDVTPPIANPVVETTTNSLEVTTNAEDKDSGIKSITYELLDENGQPAEDANGNVIQPNTSGVFNNLVENTNYIVKTTVEDNAGNITTEQTNAKTNELELGNLKFKESNSSEYFKPATEDPSASEENIKIWKNDSIDIILEENNGDSKYVVKKVGETQSSDPTNVATTVRDDGDYEVTITTTDGVNTKSETYYFSIDTKAPEVIIDPEENEILIPVPETGVENQTANIETTIRATDLGNGSGISKCKYVWLTQGNVPTAATAWSECTLGEDGSANISVTKDAGDWVLWVNVEDNAQNSTSKVSKVFAIRYVIEYDLNGGQGNIEKQKKIKDEDIILTSRIPMKDGLVFKGWAVEQNSTNIKYQPSGVYAENKSVRLYAVWAERVASNTIRRTIVVDGEEQEVDEVTYYDSVQGAINAAGTSDAIVTLLKQEIDESVTIAKGQNITLNINGKTLKSSNDSTITNRGTLKIEGEGSIINENDASGNCAVINYGEATLGNTTVEGVSNPTINGKVVNKESGAVVVDGATITAKSGTITNDETSEQNASIRVISGNISSSEGYAIVNNGIGTVCIDGGSIIGNAGIENTSSGKIIVNNGTIRANDGHAIKDSIGQIEINGGEIESTKYNGIYTDSTGSILVTNGVITGNTNGVINDANGSITITGGTVKATKTDTDGCAVNGAGTIIIGNNDDESIANRESPVIIGSLKGLNISGESNVSSFYDGIIKAKLSDDGQGVKTSIVGEVHNLPMGYRIIYGTEQIDGVEYEIAYLDNDYTVTFEENGETVETRTIEYGNKLGTLPEPKTIKEGYAFDGWYTEKDYGEKVTVDTIVRGDTTLYLRLKPNEYTITFDANGGTVNPESKTVVYDGVYGELPTPSREGYSFDRWETESHEEIKSDTKLSITENHKLVAVWQVNEYVVTLDANGGTVNPATITVTYGNTYGELPTPNREGYTFIRWVTSGKEQVTSDTQVKTAENHTLTAEYEIITYTLEYDYNGGTAKEGQTNPSTYTVEDEMTLAELEKEGYIFKGWKVEGEDDNTATTKITGGTTGNKKLVAVFTEGESSYKIHHMIENANDDNYTEIEEIVTENKVTGEKVKTDDVIELDEKQAKQIELNEEGAELKEYAIFEKATITQNGESGGTVTVNANGKTEIYVYYKRATYTLTLIPGVDSDEECNVKDLKINNESETTKIFKYGQDVTISGDFTNIAGYSYSNFKWLKENNDGSRVDFSEGKTVSNEGKTVSFKMPGGEDITLVVTAEKSINNYTITYNLNGGVIDGENIGTYTVESEGFTIINPTKNGYTFAGWTGTNLDEATLHITIEKGSTGNREYEATWTMDNYAITYNLDGGTIDGENVGTYTVESNEFTLINPTQNGYTFAGWIGTGLEQATLNVIIAKGSTGNREYIATWVPNTYKVNCNAGAPEVLNPVGTTLFYYKYNTSETIDEEEVYYYGDAETTRPLVDNKIEIPGRTGYVFKGYYEQPDGKGKQYIDENGQFVNSLYKDKTEDVTLYAYWDAISYELTYDYGTNGGQVSETDDTTERTENKKYSESMNLPTVAYKENDFFLGWADEPNSTTILSKDTPMPNSNKVVYAIFANLSVTPGSVELDLSKNVTQAINITGTNYGSITYESEDSTKAVVKQEGENVIIEAKGNGQTKVRVISSVTTADGNPIVIEIPVQVYTTPTQITVNPKNASVGVKENLNKVQLNATIGPETANSQNEIIWESSDTSIATVDSNGVVTGKAEGNVIITATTANGSISDTAEITVDGTAPTVEIVLGNDATTKKPNATITIEDEIAGLPAEQNVQYAWVTSLTPDMSNINWETIQVSTVAGSKESNVVISKPDGDETYYLIVKSGIKDIYNNTTSGNIISKGIVAIPKPLSLTYNKQEQTGVNDSGNGYTTTGNKGTNAGDYVAIAKLTDPEVYQWADGTIDNKSINWSINKATVVPSAKFETGTYTKVYDGTTNIVGGEINLSGVISGDTVTATASFEFEGPNAGQRSIIINDIELSGQDADNYKLSKNSITTTGKIEKAQLLATYVSEIIKVDETPKLEVLVEDFVNNETEATAAGFAKPVVTNTNTAIGTYKLTPTGGSATNYKFKYVSGDLTIKAKTGVNVELLQTSYTYDGTEKKPGVKVTDKNNTSKVLTAGTDYTITYSNNINAGTAKVIITLKGSYSGTVEKTFSINKANRTISVNKNVYVGVGATNNLSFTYTGDSVAATATIAKTGTASCTVTNGNKTGTIAIKGVSAGETTATITVPSSSNYNSKTETVNIKVTNLVLNPVEALIEVGETVKITPTITPSSVLSDENATKITWKSSNTAVATVTAQTTKGGVATVTGVKDGVVTITATLNGQSKTVKVTVGPNYAEYNGSTLVSYYSTLESAMKNVTSGNTIKALRSPTETIAATLESGKTATLDLNGKTITLNGAKLTNNGTLTISGAGTLTTASKMNLITNAGILNLANTGTISNTNTGAFNTVYNTGTVNKTGSGTISSTTTGAALFGGTIKVSTGTVSTSGGRAIQTSGKLTITGGTISSTSGSAVYISGSGTGTVSGTNTVIQKSGTATGSTFQNSGTVTLSGGTIKTLEGSTSGVINNSNTGTIKIAGAIIEQLGTASAVHNGYNNSTGIIELTSGSITAKNNIAIYNNNTATIKMSGGTVTSATYGIYNNAEGTITVTGGTITAEQGVRIGSGTGTISGTSTKITGKTYGATTTTGILTIKGGTITATEGTGAYVNGGKLTIGTNETTPSVSITVPSITGSTYGVNVQSGTFNFYDGILRSEAGSGTAINGSVSGLPTGYGIYKTVTNSGVEEATLRKNYTLTVNPNNGTWNSKTTSSTFTDVTGATKTIANPTPPGKLTVTYNYNGSGSANTTDTAERTFTNWTLSGGGSFVNATPVNPNTSFTMTNKTETAGAYMNFSRTITTAPTSNTYYNIYMPTYKYVSGSTYTIKFKLRVNSVPAGGAALGFRNASIKNDYGTPDRVYKYFGKTEWRDVYLTRTISGTTAMQDSTSYNIEPRFEMFTNNLKGMTGTIDFDLKDIEIINNTTGEIVQSSNSTYCYGTSNGTLKANYSTSKVTLPTPTRTGYTFDGWYKEAACTNKIGNAGASYTPTANITLYAKWKQNNYEELNGTAHVKYYVTLAEAMSGVTGGNTIKVLNTRTETAKPTLASGKTVTINLNEKTVTLSGNTLTNNGTLTISGAGKLTTASAVNLITNAGTLNLTNTGTISNTNTGAYNTIYNSGTVNKTGSGTVSSTTTGAALLRGTIKVSAGTVSTSGGRAIQTSGKLTITGGTISSTSSNAVYINGSGTGTVSGTNTIIQKSGTATGSTFQNSGTGTVTLSGGTIKTLEGSGSWTVNNSSTGTIKVSGATIQQLGTGGAVHNGGTGVVEITSGSVTSKGNYSAVHNNSTGTIKMSGGTVTGAINGIYNNAEGTITVTGGIITATTEQGVRVGAGKGTISGTSTKITGKTYGAGATTGTLTITGGTITATGGRGTYVNGGKLTIGTNEATPSVSITVPSITGSTHGVYVQSGTFSFYDGILKGVTTAINGTVAAKPKGYVVVNGTTTVSNTTYKTAVLGPSAPVITAKKTNASGATISSGTWTKENIYVSVSSSNVGAGIKEYQWYENGAWTTRALTTSNNVGTITYTVARNEAVRFRTIDNNGVISAESTFTVRIERTLPTITVNPTSATVCKSKSVTITAADTGGSGISSSNSYQYYLSSSSTSLSGGTWTNYTSGTAFTIGSGITGTRYLFVKRVSDNAGNVSTANGTATTVSNVTYQRFGSYVFDNTKPTALINTESMYVTDGIVTRLDAVNNANGSHNSSTTAWSDISGNGKNGTITGGKWGANYLDFNGTSSWVNLGVINNTTGHTLDVTFSPDVVPTSATFIIGNWESGGGGIAINNSGYIYAGLYIGGSYKTITSNVKVVAAQKYHVAFTYDGSIMILYINGVEQVKLSAPGTIGVPTNGTVMALGTNPNGTKAVSGYFDGKIYTAAVYNKALTADQVKTNAYAGKALAGGPTNASSITYTIRFSEAVTEFTTDDVTITNGTKGAFTTVTSGRVFRVVATTAASQNNTQTIALAANGCTDSSGNGIAATSKTVVIDRVAPTVTLSANGGTYNIAPGNTTVSISTTLTAKDTGSGIAGLGYAWSTSNSTEPSSWTVFTSGTAISGSRSGGNSYIWTNVIDNAGNRATSVKTSKVFTVRYQVVYNANNGSGAPSTQYKVKDTSLTLSSTKPTRTGYTFKEWNTKADGTGTKYAAGASYTANSATTLYAIWTANTYKISYNLAGGTAGAKAPTSGTYSKDVIIDNPTRSGYTFAGWTSTTANGLGGNARTGTSALSDSGLVWQGTSTTNKYFRNLTNTNGGTVTLTATWNQNNYQEVTSSGAHVKYYVRLTDAMSGVTSGNTVKVLNSKTETVASTLASGKDTILNLNGKTITLSGTNGKIINNGTLKIMNTGTIKSASTATMITNSGTLTMEKATVTMTGKGYVMENSGTFTMNSGVINSNNTSRVYAIVNWSEGKLTIKGTINAYGCAIYSESNNAVTIDGSAYLNSEADRAIYHCGAGIMTLNGGTITNGVSLSNSAETVTNGFSVVSSVGTARFYVNGATIKTSASNTNLALDVNGLFEITSGEITSGGDAVVIDRYGTHCVKGGSITAGYGGTGVRIESGNLDMSGGTILGTVGVMFSSTGNLNLYDGNISGRSGGTAGISITKNGTVRLSGGRVDSGYMGESAILTTGGTITIYEESYPYAGGYVSGHKGGIISTATSADKVQINMGRRDFPYEDVQGKLDRTMRPSVGATLGFAVGGYATLNFYNGAFWGHKNPQNDPYGGYLYGDQIQEKDENNKTIVVVNPRANYKVQKNGDYTYLLIATSKALQNNAMSEEKMIQENDFMAYSEPNADESNTTSTEKTETPAIISETEQQKLIDGDDIKSSELTIKNDGETLETVIENKTVTEDKTNNNLSKADNSNNEQQNDMQSDELKLDGQKDESEDNIKLNKQKDDGLKLEYVKEGALTILDAKNSISNNFKNPSTSVKTWDSLIIKDENGKDVNGVNGNVVDGRWEENCLKFDGKSTWVNLGNIDEEKLTLQATFAVDEITEKNQTIISNIYNKGGIIYVEGKTGYIKGGYYLNDTYYCIDSEVIVKPGEVYDVAITFDGTAGMLYVNGEKQDKEAYEVKDAITIIDVPVVMSLGMNLDGNNAVSDILKGKMYSVAVYKRVLAENEVLQNAMTGFNVAGKCLEIEDK